jgi:hypothetical protein
MLQNALRRIPNVQIQFQSIIRLFFCQLFPIFVSLELGVFRCGEAEMIPSEPDPAHTGEGKFWKPSGWFVANPFPIHFDGRF